MDAGLRPGQHFCQVLVDRLPRLVRKYVARASDICLARLGSPFRHWLMDTTNLPEEMEQPDSDSKSERWLIASDEALPLTDTHSLSLSAREESLLFDLIGKI